MVAKLKKHPTAHQPSPDQNRAKTTLPSYLRVQGDAILLSVKVQPRAPVTAIGEPLGDELRVKVTAPPVDAAANEALLRLMAETFSCGRSAVELVRGGASRHKVIKLYGLSPETVRARLAAKQR
jgi:uncharacterized protein